MKDLQRKSEENFEKEKEKENLENVYSRRSPNSEPLRPLHILLQEKQLFERMHVFFSGMITQSSPIQNLKQNFSPIEIPSNHSNKFLQMKERKEEREGDSGKENRISCFGELKRVLGKKLRILLYHVLVGEKFIVRSESPSNPINIQILSLLQKILPPNHTNILFTDEYQQIGKSNLLSFPIKTEIPESEKQACFILDLISSENEAAQKDQLVYACWFSKVWVEGITLPFLLNKLEEILSNEKQTPQIEEIRIQLLMEEWRK